MRISDWSSDVCSSDLPLPHPTSQVIILHGRWGGGAGRCHLCFSYAETAYSELHACHPRLAATIDPAPVRRGAVTRGRRDSAGRRTRALPAVGRSEEHTSELQSLMRISYAVFCLKKTKRLTNE